MKRTVRILLATAMLGLCAAATSGPALADGPRSGAWAGWSTHDAWGYGFHGAGPTYYGEYTRGVYDGYFVYDYPVYTGFDVAAVGAGFVNSRWRRQRVMGPGVVYYRGELPRGYHVNPYW